MTRAGGQKDRRRESSRSSKCDAGNDKGEKKPEPHTSIVNGTSSVSNGYKISDGSMANTESRVSTQAVPSSNVSRTCSDVEQEGKE